MARALHTTKTNKTYFAASSGVYRYWFTPEHGMQHAVLKIQMTRATMDKFMKTAEGRALTRFADINEQGGGWFEITSKDMTEWNAWFGGKACGAKIWLKAFNLSQLSQVDANPRKFVVERVRRVDPNKVLTQRPVWMPTPEEERNRERLASKMQKLAQQFAKR